MKMEGFTSYEGGSHHVHGLDVMNGHHQVEAEAVHMVFLRPIPGGVDDEVAHLLQIRCGLVAAIRASAYRHVIPVAVVMAGAVSSKLEPSFSAVWL